MNIVEIGIDQELNRIEYMLNMKYKLSPYKFINTFIFINLTFSKETNKKVHN